MPQLFHRHLQHWQSFRLQQQGKLQKIGEPTKIFRKKPYLRPAKKGVIPEFSAETRTLPAPASLQKNYTAAITQLFSRFPENPRQRLK
jgi:hypothetical protein